MLTDLRARKAALDHRAAVARRKLLALGLKPPAEGATDTEREAYDAADRAIIAEMEAITAELTALDRENKRTADAVDGAVGNRAARRAAKAKAP